jgi:hypothetical protein
MSRSVNIDPTFAVTTVLGALPGLRALQGDMARCWLDFDPSELDRLERCALSLQDAQALYQTTPRDPPSLRQQARELWKQRQRLLMSARSLADWGLIDRNRLVRFVPMRGYRPLAGDVCALVALFRDCWAEIDGKSPVTAMDLERAMSLAMALLVEVGARQNQPRGTAEAVRLRRQAFSSLADAYAQVRRRVRYLCKRRSDAERIAPSLHTKYRRPTRQTIPVTTADPEST